MVFGLRLNERDTARLEREIDERRPRNRPVDEAVSSGFR
jgi:hypothetical protein